MTVQIAHIGDLHFGGLADVPVVEALERLLPDLRPDAIVIGGDLSQRARHGELQRGRAFANRARETAPVLVIPGNHDVQWWRRPLIPFGKDAIYGKYRSYFGADLTPTLTIPGGAVIASALTAHGVAWGSLTARLRDIAVKGHLPKREMQRVQAIFANAEPGLPRVLVIHHNLLRGNLSKRMDWRAGAARNAASSRPGLMSSSAGTTMRKGPRRWTGVSSCPRPAPCRPERAAGGLSPSISSRSIPRRCKSRSSGGMLASDGSSLPIPRRLLDKLHAWSPKRRSKLFQELEN